MITVDEFQTLQQEVLGRLKKELSANLTYHSVAHTVDVLEKAVEIAKQEGVNNENEIMLLKVAALFHDKGFLEVYMGHEEKSCFMMRNEVGSLFTGEELEKICGMIMATKIPQTPLTHLEEIICDADLDYLGRNDFYITSDALRKEFLAYNIVKNEKEWEEKQIGFFEKHHYFTATSNNKRNAEKQERLTELKKKFNLQYGP
jgi:uncharacterized protein